MHAHDRRLLQVTLVAWLLFCAWTLRTVLTNDAWHAATHGLLIYGVLFVCFATAVGVTIAVALPLRIVFNLASKERRTTHRAETIVLCGVLALPVGLYLESRREEQRLAPPEGVMTLAEFAKGMPPPRRLIALQIEGRDFIAWYGEYAGPLASGPSCYLFGSDGRLVEWQPETGEGGGPAEDLVHAASHSEEITLQEALRRRDLIPRQP